MFYQALIYVEMPFVFDADCGMFDGSDGKNPSCTTSYYDNMEDCRTQAENERRFYTRLGAEKVDIRYIEADTLEKLRKMSDMAMYGFTED